MLILFGSERYDGILLGCKLGREETRDERDAYADRYKCTSSYDRKLSDVGDLGKALNYHIRGDQQDKRYYDTHSAGNKTYYRGFGVKYALDILL